VDPSTRPTGTQNTSIQNTSTQSTGMSKEYWENMDRRTRSTIQICLDDSILLNVLGECTAKEIWEKLGNLYQSKSLVNKLFL
jgi:hypothetical protein